MPPRKKVTVPQEVGFYISLTEYQENAYRSTETIGVYVRNHVGQWWVGQSLVPEAKLPADLLQLRPVQS